MNTDDTRRANAIALAKTLRASANPSVLAHDIDIRILCDAILSAPDSDGAALRRVRDYVCEKSDYHEAMGWSGEAVRMNPLINAIDRELAALRAKDTLCHTQMNKSNSALPMGTVGSNETAIGSDAKDTSPGNASGAASSSRSSSPTSRLDDLRAKDTPCTTSSDSSASSDSTMNTKPTSSTTFASADAPVADGSAGTDPAREPGADERALAEWEHLARCTKHHGDPTLKVVTDSEIDRAVALWRRLLAERDAAVSRAEAAEQLLDKTLFNIPVGNLRTHTRESIPDRINQYVTESAQLAAVADTLIDEGIEFGDDETPVAALRRLVAKLRAAQPQPARLRDIIDAVHRYDDIVRNTGSDSDGAKEARARLAAQLFWQDAQPQPAATSERVQELRGDIMRAGGIIYSAALDELCALATEPAATTAADHVKWTGNLCEALGLLSTLKGDLDCGRLTNEPVQCAREIHDHVTKQLAAARAEARKLAVEEMRKLWGRSWKNGVADLDAELRGRIAALESQAKPEAAQEVGCKNPLECVHVMATTDEGISSHCPRGCYPDRNWPPKPEAAAAPAEREGDGVLREFVEAKWLENPPELRVRALRELCRRALEGR